MTARKWREQQAAIPTTHAGQTLALVAAQLPDGAVDRLRPILAVERWALWCTLYVDSSNAGSAPGAASSWGWGARGRVGDAVAEACGTFPHLTLSGVAPEAAGADSGVGELWGIVHAVEQVLASWPWLAGVGVRCDNLETVGAVADCDARADVDRLRQAFERELRRDSESRRTAIAAARLRLAEHAAPLGLLLRATHVRGHGRADLGRQRSFNAQADRLARSAARGRK